MGASITEREIIILGVTCSVILLLLIVIAGIGIIYLWKKSKTRRKRQDRLAQTLERLSIRDPLDELVRRESRRSSLGGYMNDSMTNINSNGDIFHERRMYKIWTSNRDRKTFTFAGNLDELIEKGRDKLDLKGVIQVVLEEDGTEVDSDEVLRACAGKVLILKTGNDSWRTARFITTLETLPPDSTRF